MNEKLQELQEMRINGKNPYLISNLLQDKELLKSIKSILDIGDIMDEDEIFLLIEYLRCCRYVYEKSGYYIPITDSEYDILYEILKDNGIDINDSKGEKNDKEYHKYPALRGTIDKVYALTDDEEFIKNDSRKSLDQWIKTKERQLKENGYDNYNLNKENVYCFPKFDGVSVIFEIDSNGNLQRALTRGNTKTNTAKNVTNVFKDFQFQNLRKEYALKTEVIVSSENFDKFNEKYTNLGIHYSTARSLASALINSEDNDKISSEDIKEFLSIIPLRLAEDKESNIPLLPDEVFDYPYLITKLSDRENMKDFVETIRYVHGKYKTDGLVIYLINEKLQKILGRKDDKSQYEVAYKFTEVSNYSKIIDIEFSLGKFGNIIPVALIKPLVMKGNTIQRVSLGSMKRFYNLSLAKGDTVKVLYDIIPYLLYDDGDKKCKRSGKEPIKITTHCPECGEMLTITHDGSDMLYCKNPSCPNIKKGKILNYLEKMDIHYISFMTVETLYNLQFLKSIKDLYKLKDEKEAIIACTDLGEKTMDKIIAEIDKHREVLTSTFLGSLGIEGVGEKTFERVFSMLSYQELMEYCEEGEERAIAVLSVIPYIKEPTALKIYNGIRENKKLIHKLEKELRLLEYKRNYETKFRAVFTKIRDEETEEFIEAMGGRVEDTVKKNSTSFVIVPRENIQSTKVTKAKTYGIPIIPIDNVRDYVREKYAK